MLTLIRDYSDHIEEAVLTPAAVAKQLLASGRRASTMTRYDDEGVSSYEDSDMNEVRDFDVFIYQTK